MTVHRKSPMDRPQDSSRLERRLERERRARLRAEAIAEQATRQALHDPLTGLADRTVFMDHLTVALAASEQHGRSLAVLLIDIDRFKLINDSLGRDAGDELLVAIARRLSRAARSVDTVSRLGGDEFAVLCLDVPDRPTAEEIVARFSAAVGETMRLGSTEVVPSASIGVVLASDLGTADAVLRDADAAMYEAKRHGKARFEVFNEAMRTEALERLETESDLRHALERGQFVPYYQPVVELDTHAVVGVEALARWRHPTRGLLAPREFIPICEETGLIVALGRFMLERACSEVERLGLGSRSDIPLKLWVNLSARQLAEPDLVATVAQALTAAGRGPSTICLEITESSLMSDFERSLANLESLAELNVGIGLDDFGQGYSSLSYLKQLPVDTLKIDRSFVSGVGSDRRDTAMVAAIVGLARALGLTTVAEGVETPRQRDELRRLGCDLAQGFLFAPPLPAEAVEELLERGLPAPPLTSAQAARAR